MSGLVAGAIVGWFANKVFGPSADALGANLAAHMKSRLPQIFGRAEAIARETGIEPKPIKPGLLSRMIVDASFSDDEPEITEWWANLFVSASQHGDNKHAVFSDIMAVIGPAEATCLNELIRPFEARRPTQLLFAAESFGNIDAARQDWILEILGPSAFERARVEAMVERLEAGTMEWPIRLRAWNLYIRQAERKNALEMQSSAWFEERELAIEILARAGVLRMARVDVPVMGQPCWVDTVELTRLGAAFYLACTGAEDKWRAVERQLSK